MAVPDFLLKPEKQTDGIVDMYGNIISKEDRNNIITQISKLPVLSYLDDIIYAVKNNAIVIIEAQTGSGKTTQIGKIAPFIDLGKRGLNRVNMTQPRVLAATSNASRISQELLAQINDPSFTLGYKVGYMTGVSENYSGDTKLLLTTDGAELMRQMISGIYPEILILDEAHVYTQYLELLFALAKKGKSKVIIMTATMDKDLILDYFKDFSKNIPYFNVPGRVHKITEYVRKTEELIPTILEFHNKTGGSGLIFHPGKGPLYDTIEKVKAALKQEEVESLIGNFDSKSKELLLDPFVEIKNRLQENNGENNLIIDKVIDIDELKSFLLFLKNQFETKYKNPNFSLEKEKIFLDGYDIFSKESILKKLDINIKEIFLLKQKEIFNKEGDNEEELLELEQKYNNIKKILEKKLKELLDNEEYYSIFLGLTNKMIDKLDLIDDVFNDFIREININIIGDGKRIETKLIDMFSQKIGEGYEKENQKFEDSFLKNNSLLALEGFLYSLKNFFYDLYVNGKNSRKLALKIFDIDKYLANDKIKEEFIQKIKNIGFLFSSEIGLTKSDLEEVLNSIVEDINDREIEKQIVDLNGLISDIDNYQEIFNSIHKKFYSYKDTTENKIKNIKNNLLCFIDKKDFEKLFGDLFDELDDLLKNFSINNFSKIKNKISIILEKIDEKNIQEKIENYNFNINFSFSNQKRIQSYKNISKDFKNIFEAFFKDINKKEIKKYSGINTEKILYNFFNIIIENKENNEDEIYKKILEEIDLFKIFNFSLIEKINLSENEIKRKEKETDEYKILENSISLNKKILEEREKFIEKINIKYKQYLSDYKEKIITFISDIKKRNNDYISNKTLDGNKIINIFNCKEIRKDIESYEKLYIEKQEKIKIFNEKIKNYNLLKKDFLENIENILNNKLNKINNNKKIIYIIINKILDNIEKNFESIKNNFVKTIKNNGIYKKNFDKNYNFINKDVILKIISEILEKNINIIEKNNDEEKAISDIQEELKEFLEKEFLDIDYHKKFLEIFYSKINEVESQNDIDNIVVPLHSDLSMEEAEKNLAPGQKIRNATNAAEMSMTINGTNYVVDTGTEKVIVLDENGVETLVTRPISKASAKQRKGRTGREGPGSYIWVGPKDMDSLEDFSDTEIQRTSVSRIMLMTLAAGENLRNIKLLHPIPDYILDLGDEKLKNLGAKDDEGKITDIGKFILMIPTSEEVGRMIYEGVKRNCVGDLINIAGILEAKDFLESHNKRYKKIKFEGKDYRKTNDLYFLSKMFDLITSTNITENEYNQFIRLGINKLELDEFIKQKDKNKMLFEEVDLSLLGVKNKYVQETITKILQIKRSLDDLGIKYKKEENFENKELLYSILSAYRDNIFIYSKKDSKFVNKKKGFFNKAGISTVDENSGKFFVGYPFKIIDFGKKEKAFLSRIIQVQESDLKEAFKDDITNLKTKISLGTKIFKVPGKNGKRISKRKLVLMQTRTVDLGWVKLSDINYEIGKDSFEYMFKKVYLPNLLINENYKFISFIQEMEKNASKGEKFNYSKFISIISKKTEGLYEYFMKSKKNLKKIESYFRNEESIYEEIMKSKDTEIISFLLDPYIKIN